MQERQIAGYTGRGRQYYAPGPSETRPAPPAPQPDPPPQTPRTLKTREKRRWPLIVVLISVITGAAGTGVYLFLRKDASPLPSSVASQVNFTPYLPDNSRGVTVNRNSYAWQQGVLTFTATTPAHDQVFVSEQSVPRDFDLSNFLQHIKSRQTLTNKYGNGDAGISENNLVISEVISDTWVFMSGSINMDPSQLGFVFYSLHK